MGAHAYFTLETPFIKSYIRHSGWEVDGVDPGCSERMVSAISSKPVITQVARGLRGEEGNLKVPGPSLPDQWEFWHLSLHCCEQDCQHPGEKPKQPGIANAFFRSRLNCMKSYTFQNRACTHLAKTKQHTVTGTVCSIQLYC